MKKAFKFVIFIGGLLAVLLLLMFTLLEYKPKEQEVVFRSSPIQNERDTFCIFSWNIGYAGLSREMDFFYDGGKQTRISKEKTFRNIESISNFIRSIESDIYLLQEVDISSKRSWNIDQLSYISNHLLSYYAYFGLNYSAVFVPIPILHPMGKVESGLASFTRLLPSEVVRYSYPPREAWPSRIFSLKRCILVTTIPLKNNRNLIVINTHNSAFDKGEMRKGEMKFLKEFLLSEYQKGNYIVVGGDWNQTPPIQDSLIHFDRNAGTKNFRPLHIEQNYMPEGWLWLSTGYPTNRFTDIPYKKGTSQETLLDFFLISPNIKALKVETFDLKFEYSDHQPVRIKFCLDSSQE